MFDGYGTRYACGHVARTEREYWTGRSKRPRMLVKYLHTVYIVDLLPPMRAAGWESRLEQPAAVRSVRGWLGAAPTQMTWKSLELDEDGVRDQAPVASQAF